MKKSHLFAPVLGLFILAGCQPSTTEQSAESAPVEEASPTIEGAWELVSITGDEETFVPFKSIIIFTDKYYSVEIALEDRPSWGDLEEGEETAVEDIVNAYEGLISNSGTYSIEGDSLIREAIVAKFPNYMNEWPRTASAFELSGDQMTTLGGQGVWTYKRLK